MHELANVLRPLDNDNGNFVVDYPEAYPTTRPGERRQTMGYFALGVLPALHELARHFTACDHWYARQFLAKLRNELRNRSEHCPCTGATEHFVELQVREERGKT